MIKKKTALNSLVMGLIFTGIFCLGKICPAAEDPAGPPFTKKDRNNLERSEIGPEESVGVKEVPRPDGGKDKIFFSITPDSSRRAREQAEKDKLERSLDFPGNVYILKH